MSLPTINSRFAGGAARTSERGEAEDSPIPIHTNEAWTLFLLNLSGGSQSAVYAWGLDSTAVPQATNLALGIFGGIATLVAGAQWVRRRAKPVIAPARTLGQAMKELGVIGRGDFTDLSTNKAHLDDFGK
jgi:hypothetical protein